MQGAQENLQKYIIYLKKLENVFQSRSNNKSLFKRNQIRTLKQLNNY